MQTRQQFEALLAASEPLGSQSTRDGQLSALLEVLIDTLSVCDEGSIYVVDSERRTLRQEISLGPYSWFGQFPEFRLGEGNVGRAFQIGEPVASESRQQLERYLEGLGTVREESLAQQPASFSPPLVNGGEIMYRRGGVER